MFPTDATEMESHPIRLPYKHLKDAELELVGVDDSRVANGVANGGTASSTPTQSPPSHPMPSQQARFGGLKMLILASTVGAGVQFGWALQLSLLTPYIQAIVFLCHCFWPTYGKDDYLVFDLREIETCVMNWGHRGHSLSFKASSLSTD
ncbi:sugar transporter [Asimina triloba]